MEISGTCGQRDSPSVNPDSHPGDPIPNLEIGVNRTLNLWHALYAICVRPDVDF